MESASCENEKRQGSTGWLFKVPYKRSAVTKNHLVCGFPEEHRDIAAAKEPSAAMKGFSTRISKGRNLAALGCERRMGLEGSVS